MCIYNSESEISSLSTITPLEQSSASSSLFSSGASVTGSSLSELEESVVSFTFFIRTQSPPRAHELDVPVNPA